MMTDPLADMLARIRNGLMARHAEVSCPSSKLKRAVAEVLQKGGFLRSVRVEPRRGHPTLLLSLRYSEEGLPLIDGLRRVSTPGRRVYVKADELPRVRNGLGISVLSTSRGVVSDAEARAASIGGEVLCEVW